MLALTDFDPEFLSSAPPAAEVCSEEDCWFSAQAWVDENFRWICRHITKFRPVPFVVETRDLRQIAYLTAFETLQAVSREQSLHKFVPFFFTRLGWVVKETYPWLYIDSKVPVETVASADTISFLPGLVWPQRLNDRVCAKALGSMRSAERAAWTAYFEDAEGTGRFPKRRFYKLLSAGIQSVFSQATNHEVAHD